jgi:hypothetical protein
MISKRIAILLFFTAQIPMDDPEMIGPDEETEESWHTKIFILDNKGQLIWKAARSIATNAIQLRMMVHCNLLSSSFGGYPVVLVKIGALQVLF